MQPCPREIMIEHEPTVLEQQDVNADDIFPLLDINDDDNGDNNDNGVYLPLEIWEVVVSWLSRRDRRRLCACSANLWRTVRPLLWSEPAFDVQLDLPELNALAELDIPIQRLKISQLDFYNCSNSKLEEMVGMLHSKFHLTQFIVDEWELFEGYPLLSLQQLECLLQLPLPVINTRYFSCQDPEELVNLLMELPHCPDIIIHEDFHRKMYPENWHTLLQLPIIEIHGSFGYLDNEDYDLELYDQLVAKIFPPPRFIFLNCFYPKLTPEHLSQFSLTRISELHLNILDPRRNLTEYIEALEFNQQEPQLVFPPKDNYERYCTITPAELQLLFRFPVKEFHTSFMYINKATVNQVAEYIVSKHLRDPIQDFILDAAQGKRVFDLTHLDSFLGAGLITSKDLERIHENPF